MELTKECPCEMNWVKIHSQLIVKWSAIAGFLDNGDEIVVLISGVGIPPRLSREEANTIFANVGIKF